MRYIIKAVAHLQGIEGHGTILYHESYAHRRHAEKMMLALIGIDVTEDCFQCTVNRRYEPNEQVDDVGRQTWRYIVLENETIRKEYTLIEW